MDRTYTNTNISYNDLSSIYAFNDIELKAYKNTIKKILLLKLFIELKRVDT